MGRNGPLLEPPSLQLAWTRSGLASHGVGGVSRPQAAATGGRAGGSGRWHDGVTTVSRRGHAAEARAGGPHGAPRRGGELWGRQTAEGGLVRRPYSTEINP